MVQELSNHIEISEGTVYPLLRRLGNEEYFTTYLQESSEGPPRKYYRLLTKGKEYLQVMIKEWLQFSEGVNQLILVGDQNE